MLFSILVILFAWFIEMPLWLSIFSTCVGALSFTVNLVKMGIELQKKWSEDKSE